MSKCLGQSCTTQHRNPGCWGNRNKKEKQQPRHHRDRKQFRISELQVHWVNIDTDLSSRDESTGMEDLVVSITTKDGSKFEVERIRIKSEGLAGYSTATAKLVCRKSWGDEGREKEDPSVSCPLCLFDGHGAQACKDLKESRRP